LLGEPSLATGCESIILAFGAMDSGCEPDPSFFGELVEAGMLMPRSAVPIAAPVVGAVESPAATPINHYLTQEAIAPMRTSTTEAHSEPPRFVTRQRSYGA